MPYHPFPDLLRSGRSVETGDDITNYRNRIFLSQFFGPGQIGSLSCQKMVRRDDRQVVSGILQLHRVTFFAWKIDQYLIEQEIPIGHAAKPPAFVQAERARP